MEEMHQFYVMELQRYQNGEYGNIVHYAYDKNQETARLKGESKYYEVLAAAAISDLPEHGAILMTSGCDPLLHKCYYHPIQTAE